MAGARDDDRIRVGEHPAGQGRAGGHQRDGVLRAGSHHLQVIAAGENARLAGEDHYRAVLFRLVQSLVQSVDYGGGNGIHLAVVESQCGDAVFELVGKQLSHGGRS
ncbi:hypothetical protein D9M70_544700 [compost metagenome]